MPGKLSMSTVFQIIHALNMLHTILMELQDQCKSARTAHGHHALLTRQLPNVKISAGLLLQTECIMLIDTTVSVVRIRCKLKYIRMVQSSVVFKSQIDSKITLVVFTTKHKKEVNGILTTLLPLLVGVLIKIPKSDIGLLEIHGEHTGVKVDSLK